MSGKELGMQKECVCIKYCPQKVQQNIGHIPVMQLRMDDTRIRDEYKNLKETFMQNLMTYAMSANNANLQRILVMW